jgi:hypothetical protein
VMSEEYRKCVKKIYSCVMSEEYRKCVKKNIQLCDV